MEHGVHAVGRDGADLRDDVAGVVDRVGRAERGDLLDLLLEWAVAMTVAPARAASCSACWPTPPVAPTTSTVSPSVMSAASTALTAAVPAKPRPPACVNSIDSGSFAIPTAVGTVTHSANEPSPRKSFMTTPNTRSPTA